MKSAKTYAFIVFKKQRNILWQSICFLLLITNRTKFQSLTFSLPSISDVSLNFSQELINSLENWWLGLFTN